MGVLLVHGAGYQKDVSLRYLQRQRLRSGLTAGFVAAGRLTAGDALNRGLEDAEFPVRVVEYSEALNEPERSDRKAPEIVPLRTSTDWEPIRKVRCLCCPTTSRARANVRDWSGNVTRDLSAATDSVIKRRMPDVHRYLQAGPATAEALHAVRQEILGGAKVVVAHSLGSVVALDALARVSHEDTPRLLVTIGSPLRFEAIRRRLNAAVTDWIRSRSTAWVNVHDRADVITAGGSLPLRHYPGVINVAVHNGSHYHAGDYYLRHPIVGALIWDVASGELEGDALRRRVPAAYGDLFKYRDG